MSNAENPILSAIERFPNEPAFDDSHRRVRYGELAELMDGCRLCHDVRAGDHIAWCPTNDFDSFLNFWTVATNGAVACPISSRFPPEEREAIIEQLDARWLSGSSTFASGQPVWRRRESRVEQATQADFRNRPATIILSSGSTGTPKAIVHSMLAHVASAIGAATNMPLTAGDRWLWGLPLYHVSGLSILVRCAVAGATVVGFPESPELTAQFLAEQRITHLSLVATQLRRLLASKQFPSPHLKAVLVGGSSVPAEMVSNARARGVNVRTTYGLTEMASQVTTSTNLCDPASSGRVLPNRELVIAESGEILVRGEPLCLGYYLAGQIDPVIDEEGWFHTRDIGSLDADGRLRVTGRIDNLFISGGENIYPETVERALLKLASVEQAIVVPTDDHEFGTRPVAFIKGQLTSNWETELRKSLRGFEIPVKILDWPEHAMLGIKPDRKQMRELANRLLSSRQQNR